MRIVSVGPSAEPLRLLGGWFWVHVVDLDDGREAELFVPLTARELADETYTASQNDQSAAVAEPLTLVNPNGR